jgi:uncharacterized protein (TIGR03437 family)
MLAEESMAQEQVPEYQRKRLARFSAVVFAGLFLHSLCWAQGYTITTVAGSASLFSPGGVAVDLVGNLYIADKSAGLIWKVSTNGTISIGAGTLGFHGYSGDGGPATSAELNSPTGVAVDTAGNLYVADSIRIRKIDIHGTITTIAGGGSLSGPSADGGPATSASLLLNGVAVDGSGNLYFSDGAFTSLIRKVSSKGIITTVAGGGLPPNLGDGGPAKSGSLGAPNGVAVDASGNLFIADTLDNRVRKVTTNGIITTVAGSNSGSYSGDGGPANQAGLNQPNGVAVDSTGNLYITDSGDHVIRMVTPRGTITTIAGNGDLGSSGDGGSATSATLGMPLGIALGSRGEIYISDQAEDTVRLLTPKGSPAGSPPTITSGGVVSAGAFGAFASVAPGSWIEIYGSNLASDSRGWSGSDFNGVNAPTSLDGTSVTVGGQSAFVDYISPGQVNAQVPSNVAAGSQPVIVTAGSVASSPFNIAVNAEQPGLLAPSTFIIGGKQYVGALFPDGVTFALPPGAIAGVPSRRAQPGDNVTLYGVGFGSVTPNIQAGQIVQEKNALALPFHLNFGQAQATVTYAGLAPNAVGLYQFNVTVPNIPSSDAVPVTFWLGGAPGTQTLYISVQNGTIAAQVQSVTFSASSVAGGGTVQGTVVLSEPAPAGGAVVALSSSSSAATVPATVTVRADDTSANFTISTGAASSNQTATITATYVGSIAQATLTVTQAAGTAPFVSLLAPVTFQPVGYPSGQLVLQVTPNAGNVTYTATISGLTFVNGVASNQNQTFTFSALQPGTLLMPTLFYGTPTLQVSSASLTFTLAQSYAAGGFAAGSLTGTMNVTGTPIPAGGASVTASGAIVGNYEATLPPQ